VLRDVLAKDGVRGLYRGYWASIAQNVPSSGIWWTAYGLIRNKGYAAVPKNASPERRAWLQRGAETLSGFSAGACTAVLGCPLDVIRVRVQVRGTPVGDTVRQLLAQEGVAGFWKGAGARFWMLAPNGAVIISAYELVKRLSLRDELREEFNTPNPIGWV
jgi:solute carrier family 25 protein 44